MYLIWSNEHNAWWGPDRRGYALHLAAAGRYTREDALSICQSARDGWRDGEPPPEIPVWEPDAVLIEGRERKAREALAQTKEAGNG